MPLGNMLGKGALRSMPVATLCAQLRTADADLTERVLRALLYRNRADDGASVGAGPPAAPAKTGSSAHISIDARDSEYQHA